MNVRLTKEGAIRFVKIVMEVITVNAIVDTNFHRTITPALVRFFFILGNSNYQNLKSALLINRRVSYTSVQNLFT